MEYVMLKDAIDKLVQALESSDRMCTGVSAPEIGLKCAAFALRSYPNEPFIVAFNPKIVHYSDEYAVAEETCYSYPGLFVKIKRPYSIRVRFQESNGEVVTKQYDGAIARAFQHEMTHINNYPFWNDANFINKQKAIKDWKILQRRTKKEQG